MANNLQTFKLPLDNRVFKDMPKRVLNSIETSLGHNKVLMSAVIRVAMKRHKTFAHHVSNFFRNRLTALLDLTEFRDEAGKWMPISNEIFGYISSPSCNGLCCRADVFPMALKVSEFYGENLLSQDEKMKLWFNALPAHSFSTILKMVSLLEEMERLLPKIVNFEEPIAKPDVLHAPFTRSAKRRGVSPPSDDVFERTQKMANLWREFKLLNNPKGVIDVNFFSYPFEKVCVPAPRADFFLPYDEESLKQIWSSGPKTAFPLITGKNCLSIEMRYANAFAEICQRPDNYLSFARSHFVQKGGVPIAFSMRNHTAYLLPTLEEYDEEIEWHQVMNSMEEEIGISIDTTERHFDVTQLSNFGYQQLSNEKHQAWQDNKQGPVILMSLLDHVASLEMQLKNCFPSDNGFSNLVETRNGITFCLNPLFFLDSANVCIGPNSVCTIIPALTLHKLHFPPDSFVLKNQTTHHLLCNNMARFFYRAVTGHHIPAFSIDYDDDDGLFRAEFARKVNTVTSDRRFLEPTFFHFILCLYLGDCDLRDPAFRTYALQALQVAYLVTAESELSSTEEIKNLQKEIRSRDIVTSAVFTTYREIQRPSPGSDLVASFFAAFKNEITAEKFPESMPILRFAGELGTGIGPHKELLVHFLVDVCRHDTFYLEIDADKRSFIARKQKTTVCQVCQKNVGKDEDSKCILLKNNSFSMHVADCLVIECLEVNAILPLVFSMSAIAAAFSTIGKCLPRVLLCERSTLARKIADTTFENRQKITGFDLPASVRESRATSPSFTNFRCFNTEMCRNQDRAFQAMYTIINRVAYFGEEELSLEIRDVEARVMVVSMLVPFEDLCKKLQFFAQEIEINYGSITSFKVLQTIVDCVDNLVLAVSLAETIALLFKYKDAIISYWSLFRWLSVASATQLNTFLRVLGFPSGLLSRCKGMFFRNDNHVKRHIEAINFCKKLIAAGDDLCLSDLTAPEANPTTLKSSYWLSEDAIGVNFDEDKQRMPHVSTCKHTITLPIGANPERLEKMMEYLLASGDRYSMA